MKAPATLDEFYRSFPTASLLGGTASPTLARRLPLPTVRWAQRRGRRDLRRWLPARAQRPRYGQDWGRDRRRATRADETTVFTDAWGSYKTLGKLRIDHCPRKGGHGRQALDILPRAHTVFGNLKTWLRGTFHGVSPKHLQRCLDEFSYRFDRRWREGELFGFVLRRVAAGQPLPYRQLVAEGTA